ncbi:MAG: TasA family protein [Candidatus Woesebacteria bacterium]|nr:TasA family protein [Candidatus Woesebacteria bacterium]
MKKILLSLAMIAVVSSTAVGATKAYFSDDGTSFNNTFSSGTLDLKLADSDEGWSDNVSGTWNSPANWKPGDEVRQTIRLYNTGSTPADIVYAYWNNLRDPAGLANKVQITWIEDSTWPGVGDISAFVTAYDAEPKDGKLSLAELISGRDRYASSTTPAPFQAKFYADQNMSFAHPVVPYNGGPFDITIGYKFMEDAGNEYQGASLIFDLTFRAAQMH